jgi:hypothetical protein
MSDKRVFTASDGREYAIIKPSVQLLNEAARVRQRVFNRAFEEGGLLRQQVDAELKSRNLWNEKLQAEYDSTQLELVVMLNKLDEGGIKLSEARQLAIDIAAKRQKLVDMLVDRSELDNMTCEGQADNERFNFLFANCLVYNDTGEKVYPNGLEDYIANPSHPGAQAGSSEFYYLLTNSENIQDTLPENQFLKKYKFIDEQSRFVERGTERLVDVEGKYVDEEGYYIEYNEDGSSYRVNALGDKVEDVKEVVEEEDQKTLPFLDDDGNPLDDDGNPIVVEKPKPKRKTRTTKKATAKADT